MLARETLLTPERKNLIFSLVLISNFFGGVYTPDAQTFFSQPDDSVVLIWLVSLIGIVVDEPFSAGLTFVALFGIRSLAIFCTIF